MFLTLSDWFHLQDRDAYVDPTEKVSVDSDFATSEALKALEFVIENGQKIRLDHYILYHART